MSTMENENTEEKEQDIVNQGVHNYSAAETYCRPAEPIFRRSWNGSRTRSWLS